MCEPTVRATAITEAAIQTLAKRAIGSRPDAFGNVVNKTRAAPNNDFYRGEQNDPGLSLDYLRGRWYNPVADRFLSRDPEPGRIAIPGRVTPGLVLSRDRGARPLTIDCWKNYRLKLTNRRPA
jgi:RHS repeat-associated protein